MYEHSNEQHVLNSSDYLLFQDVMVVGEPTLMGGEFGDKDERLIARLENAQYDPTEQDPSGLDMEPSRGGGSSRAPNTPGGYSTNQPMPPHHHQLLQHQQSMMGVRGGGGGGGSRQYSPSLHDHWGGGGQQDKVSSNSTGIQQQQSQHGDEKNVSDME